MDYRELLMKYIAHVGRCEGVTHLTPNCDWSLRDMTPEEIATLRTLAKESRKYDELNLLTGVKT